MKAESRTDSKEALNKIVVQISGYETLKPMRADNIFVSFSAESRALYIINIQ